MIYKLKTNIILAGDVNFDDAERSFLRERKEEFLNIDKNNDRRLDEDELKVKFCFLI